MEQGMVLESAPESRMFWVVSRRPNETLGASRLSESRYWMGLLWGDDNWNI